MSEISLRPMEKSDLSQVNLILAKAFTHGRIEQGDKEPRVPLCRREFLEMYLTACPQGCLVAEVDGKIVAYAFCRLWGKVGWMGPLGVLPAYQGKDLGKRIVSTCVEFLQASGAHTIGLETMPRHYKNLGFYSKLNFVPQQLCVDLTKEVFPKPESDRSRDYELLRYSWLSDSEREEFLSRVRALCNKIEPGLDYGLEIHLARAFGFGDALLMVNGGNSLGFALAHTEPYTVEENRDLLRINLVIIEPEQPLSLLEYLVAECENLARREHLSNLCFRVPTRYWRGYHFLIANGFKVTHSDLRMTLSGYQQRDNPDTINFSKWE